MKNNLLKYYLVAIYFGSTLLMFAQPGTDDEAGGTGLEDTDPLPVDGYVWVLAAVALVYVFLKFKNADLKENGLK